MDPRLTVLILSLFLALRLTTANEITSTPSLRDYVERAIQRDSGCQLIGEEVNLYQLQKNGLISPNCFIDRSHKVIRNACFGGCISMSLPKFFQSVTFGDSDKKMLTHSRCCSVKTTHDVIVELNCLPANQHMTLKSAKTCSCSRCW